MADGHAEDAKPDTRDVGLNEKGSGTRIDYDGISYSDPELK